MVHLRIDQREVAVGKSVSLYEAKMHLSELVERAAAGEEIVIARLGKPVARLLPLDRATVVRRPGAWKGRVRIAADFDAPLPSTVPANFDARRQRSRRRGRK